MKNSNELIDIITKNYLQQALFFNDFDDVDVEGLGLGELEYKDKRCDTSEFWQVIYFKDHDIYLKISGWYDSYGQGEHSYDSIKEVKPKDVILTTYE